MSDSKKWEILARYLSNECSGEEKEKVESWLLSDPENQSFIKLMKDNWNTPEPKYQKSDVQTLWQEAAERAGIKSKVKELKSTQTAAEISKTKKWPFNFQSGGYRILRYAALLFFAVSLSYFYVRFIRNPSQEQFLAKNEITVENGKHAQFTLDDGTKITLDAGSTFSYSDDFNKETREVFLNGEGYFEVSPNPEKPFIINTHSAVITVLGTKFNVRAWQRYREVKVAVTEGKVSFRTNKTADEEVIITRGQLSILYNGGKPTEPRVVDVNKHLLWQKYEFDFVDTPFSEILDQLERWHDLQISLTDAATAADRLTVHIQNKPVDDILELIGALTDLRYKRTGENVIFSKQ